MNTSNRPLSRLALALVMSTAAIASIAPVQAAPDPKRDAELEARFKAADKDKNGCLTLEEATQGMPRVARGFDKIDTAKKGCITLDQIKAFADKQ